VLLMYVLLSQAEADYGLFRYTTPSNTRDNKSLRRQDVYARRRVEKSARRYFERLERLPDFLVDIQSDFFEAFKAFDEAGSPMRIQCLK